MKVLLVKPKPELKVAKRLQEGFLHLEPLELEIVAAGIPNDVEVKILDLSVERRAKRSFAKTIKTFKPDIIGFSAYSTTIHIVKQLAHKAKVILPKSIMTVGGIHATLLPADFANTAIDYVMRGEGANALRAMIDRLRVESKLDDGQYILSVSDVNFEADAKKAPPPYVSVDEIPLPRRDLVDRSKYFCVWSHAEDGKLETIYPQVASLRTSLGCPFTCSFCVIHHVMNRKYLQRDIDEVVDEIASLDEKYIYFVDDEMFINVERVRKLAEKLIECGLNKKFISWARSDTIVKNKDLFELWKKAGLDIVYVGLESMNQKKLEEYNKKAGAETNFEAVNILKELDISLHASFIVDPDFSEEDFDQLEADVRSISPIEVSFTVLSPSPGTQFWHDCKGNFICDPYKYYDCMHAIIPTKLPLKRFYKRVAALNSLGMDVNPLKVNRVLVPIKDLLRIIFSGIKYVRSLKFMYKDYPVSMR